MSPLSELDHLPKDDIAFVKESELQDYIQNLPCPNTQEEALEQFQELYQRVSIEDWLQSELVFDLGNFIMRYRPDLVSLGIRINVQVNLLRSIEKYAADPDAIFEKIGHSVGCFALTEEDAVFSGLRDTTGRLTEKPMNILITGSDSKKIRYLRV